MGDQRLRELPGLQLGVCCSLHCVPSSSYSCLPRAASMSTMSAAGVERIEESI
jgi:hypothetical protein